MGCSSRLGFEDVLFLLRGCEAQVHEAAGCHPGPARRLPNRGGGSPWAGPGACSPAGPPEPAARPSAQTPGCPGGLTGSLAGVFRQLASLVPLWCVQAPMSRLCVDRPEVCREALGTVHGSVPASQQARPRLICSSRSLVASLGADHVHLGREQRGSQGPRRGPGGRAGEASG